MERNPAGSYGALFVVAKGISNKQQWKYDQKDSFTYEVLGGTHLSLATQRMNKKQPNNPHFAGRMCRIYVGLSDEQAVYLGGMHQQSSMFQHDITYREEARQTFIFSGKLDTRAVSLVTQYCVQNINFSVIQGPLNFCLRSTEMPSSNVCGSKECNILRRKRNVLKEISL